MLEKQVCLGEVGLGVKWMLELDPVAGKEGKGSFFDQVKFVFMCLCVNLLTSIYA